MGIVVSKHAARMKGARCCMTKPTAMNNAAISNQT
jgi:hypothetical protein